jgi:hypothetical protein
MSEGTVVGLAPWLPWPLARYDCWTKPVRAERLAALRIGVGLVLLFDILFTYLPRAGDFFGRDGLSSPGVFAMGGQVYRWSVLRSLENPAALKAILLLWAAAAVGLIFGWLPRVSALVAWVLSTSIIGLNLYIHNSGDSVRTIALFYLAISPCGAVWCLSFSKKRIELQQPVFVQPWPIRLLALQLALIYVFNGFFKITGAEWRDGSIMHYVLANLSWTRFSYAQLPMPDAAIPLLSWSALFFELSFPVLVLSPITRWPLLALGVLFHLGTGMLLQLGPFPFYMICLYLPLLPWGSRRFEKGGTTELGRPPAVSLPGS